MNHEQESHPIISVLLLVIGWTVNMFAEISGEILYLWFFRSISVVSIILIILMNWRKAIGELRILLKIKS